MKYVNKYYPFHPSQHRQSLLNFDEQLHDSNQKYFQILHGEVEVFGYILGAVKGDQDKDEWHLAVGKDRAVFIFIYITRPALTSKTTLVIW
jgi:hypothetical protein